MHVYSKRFEKNIINNLNFPNIYVCVCICIANENFKRKNFFPNRLENHYENKNYRSKSSLK